MPALPHTAVPIAEFKDRLSELVAAAEAGEDIVITRHGRNIAKVIGMVQDKNARKREAIDALYALGQQIRARNGPTTSSEIREWIEEGRR